MDADGKPYTCTLYTYIYNIYIYMNIVYSNEFKTGVTPLESTILYPLLQRFHAKQADP